jgi:hypothetical protein
MDGWGWEQLRPWLTAGPSCRWGCCSASSTAPPAGDPGQAPRSSELRGLARKAGVRRRFAPHQLRHAHALELAREGVPLNIIQRQLGHANLGTTSIYLQGIDPEEIIAAVRRRRAPMMRPAPGCDSERPDHQRERYALPLRRTEAGVCTPISDARASSKPGVTSQPACTFACLLELSLVLRTLPYHPYPERPWPAQLGCLVSSSAMRPPLGRRLGRVRCVRRCRASGTPESFVPRPS